MLSIKELTQHTIYIKKSEFICTLIPVSDESKVKDLLAQYGKSDATHNCYAYIIGNSERASDDGEPSQTAGMPMLNVLKMQNISNVLAIVTRYFGGIKLGAGGLTRAYTGCVAQTLKLCEIVETELVNLYQIDIDYSFSKKFDYFIKTNPVKCIHQEYTDVVTYKVYIKDKSLLTQISDMTSGSALIEKIGEEYIEKADVC